MPTPLDQFIQALQQPSHRFADTLAFITQHYYYQPCSFSNGPLHNAAGENQGSCKIFSLALLEQLSQEQALQAFGEHYQQVLATPNGQDHQNIRQFMLSGFAGLNFSQPALSRR